MNERVVQFRVGVTVVASLLITGTLVVLFGESPRFIKRIFQPTYTVRLWFPEGRGLTEDGLVRRNGILIGRVASIEFASEVKGLPLPEGIDEPEYLSGILVAAEIRKEAKLYQHDVCQVETDLLGKTSLHFRRLKDQPAVGALVDTEKVLIGRVAPDPLDSLSAVTTTLDQLAKPIRQASEALAGAGDELKAAAKKVDTILDEQTQDNLQEATRLAKESLEGIRDMIGEKETRDRLKTALDRLPDDLATLSNTMKKAEKRLDEVQAFTAKLGSDEMVTRLDQTTRHLDQVMADLSVLSQSLKDPQGSLGLLLQDRQLYDHLSEAAENVDDLTRQLKPILDDVRVFSDKVARHPERLGARGILQRYPGIK